MMMSLSEYNFSEPTRQSKVAIILLIIKYYKIVIRQSIPLIAVLFVGSKRNLLIIWGVVIAITLIVFVLAIMAYYRFYFRVENNELIIQKGVFKKTRLNIPFERIQTVNFEQNLLLQVFQKYKVEVDTAGSSKKEFSFDALDKNVAEQLRAKILARKKAIKLEQNTHEDSLELLETHEEPQIEETIISLSPVEIFKIGITENHIKAGAWLIAVFGYFFSVANDIGLKIEDRIEDSMPENIDPGIALIFSSLLGILLVLMVISLIRTFLKYYDLKFNRMESGFKIFSGLINRKEYSAPDNKIQKFAWGDNPIKRIFGIFIIWLKQAKSADSDRNKSISIPVISQDHVDKSLEYLYGDESKRELYSFGISKHFFTRNFIYFISIPAVIITGILIFFEQYYFIVIPILYFLYFTVSTFVQYRKAAYSFNDFMIKRKSGIYGNHYELFPWYKVQSVELNQSIYQRRHNLATVYFFTAAGFLKIPYISLEIGMKLRDYALYKAESSQEAWM